MGDYRILVTGSRTWDDEATVRAELGKEIQKAYVLGLRPVVVHGNCMKGPDLMADRLAAELKVAREPHRALWELYGRAAGMIRNGEMAEAGAVVCLAFIRGGSRGATNCAGQARKAGIPVREIPYEPGVSV